MKKKQCFVCNQCSSLVGKSLFNIEGWKTVNDFTHLCPKCQRGEYEKSEIDLFVNSVNITGWGSCLQYGTGAKPMYY